MTSQKTMEELTTSSIEIKDESVMDDEAVKYCKERSQLLNGKLISLPNQHILDDISKKVKNFMCNTNHIWKVGLDCNDGSYKWLNGLKFEKNQCMGCKL